MRVIALLLLASVACASPAQPANFGDWSIVSAEDGSGDVIAGTFTEGGEILAYRCSASDGNCRYALMPNTNCAEGSSYPMLVNAEGGAALVTGLCFKQADKNQLLLQPYKPIEDAVRGGTGMVGIAMPMASGAFKAVRFSVRGGSAATQEAENRIVQRRRSATTIDNPRQPRATTF